MWGSRSLAAMLLPLVCLMLAATGCNSEAKRSFESGEQMKILLLEMVSYEDQNGAWPDTLPELEAQIGSERYAELIANPLTGDNPGYEYVKPPEDMTATSLTVVLYQLRDGKRDETQKVGFADASVRPIDSM